MYYTEGKEPRDDFFPGLLYVFEDLRDADALISLGVTSMIGGRWNPQAVYWCFDSATKIEPDNASAWLNKAALLGAGKQYEDAIAAVERAVELRPENYSYWQQKGGVLHGAGRNAEARDAYLRASELRLDRSDTWRNLGNVYMDLGNHRDALRAFNRSIDLGADYDYVRLGWQSHSPAQAGAPSKDAPSLRQDHRHGPRPFRDVVQQVWAAQDAVPAP